MSNLIPSQTGLTLRRTDMLINLTNKLLAKTGVKGIGEMSDDELWEWWLGIDGEWKFLLLSGGLELELWQNDDWEFNKAYDYQADFDWLNRELVFGYIKELQQITELNLWGNQIQDITLIAHLTQLIELHLGCNQIRNISALANLEKLKRLTLDNNKIQDISPLSNLKNLIELELGNNKIENIKPLSYLKNLSYLDISYNEIQDIKPLSYLKNLSYLDISYNEIQDIKHLDYLKNLKEIRLKKSLAYLDMKDILWMLKKFPDAIKNGWS